MTTIVGIKEQLGQSIRILRLSRRWSQDVLAEIAGLHRNYIGHVERAELNAGIVNLDKIARAFEISLHELLCMDNLYTIVNKDGNTSAQSPETGKV